MATLFDHVNAIYTDQSLEYFDNLDEKEQRGISPFMINRVISMTEDYLPVVNEFQKYLSQVDGRVTYLFYSQFLPKRRVYSKYVKGKADGKYEDWVVDLVKKHYEISTAQSKYYISILSQTEDGIAELKSIFVKYGTDPKKIKKW